jgi:MinD superfamily P-loop ATPase
MKKIKIAIASGKGGVGKSMFASTLAMFFAKDRKVVAIDADVDAPNLHLWLGLKEGEWDQVEKISVSEKPVIDPEKCDLCGQCVEICAFDALTINNKQLIVNNFLCEGCGACEVVCPRKAIRMEKIKNAEVRVKKKIHGFPLISAQLYPGETGSGKIVEEIKKRAEDFPSDLVILDTPAGTGCPVIAALREVDLVVLVTEPTPSGFSDLKRALAIVNHFKIPYRVVINKWDLNSEKSQEIRKWAQDSFLGQLGYDQQIFQAIAQLKPIMKTNLPVKKEIESLGDKLKRDLWK